MGSVTEWSVCCGIAGTIKGHAGVCVLNARQDPGLVRTYTSA